jgi:hypothetical protein
MKLLNLTLKTIVLVAVAFLFGASGAIAVGAPDFAVPAGAIFTAFCFIPKGPALKGALFTITAADVVTEWGAVYRAEGQGVQDIILKLRQKSVTAGYFPQRITEKTIMEKVSASFARVLQRFQKAYTPIGGTTFEPVKIPLQKLKIDTLETPDDLEETWLGFLADNSLKRQDWPFIKWYLSYLSDQADSDLEKFEIYAGVPGAITPGTATAAGTNILGIKKQINDFNTAGKLNLINMGAVPTNAEDFVDYVETMFKSTDRPLRNEIDNIFMEQDKVDLFRDGMRSKYNTYYNQVDDNMITKLRNYNVQLIGLPSMVGADKIWFTPSWNRQMGFKKPGNERVFQVENVDRNVKAYTDYYKGFGFWIPEYVTSNDVELT